MPAMLSLPLKRENARSTMGRPVKPGDDEFFEQAKAEKR
jgi:hypothetical protein